jgi:hypothetical protein
MKAGPQASVGSNEARSEFERECSILTAFAKEWAEIIRRIGGLPSDKQACDTDRRSELLAMWWAEWLRMLPVSRAAGVTLADFRALQPPIL